MITSDSPLSSPRYWPAPTRHGRATTPRYSMDIHAERCMLCCALLVVIPDAAPAWARFGSAVSVGMQFRGRWRSPIRAIWRPATLLRLHLLSTDGPTSPRVASASSADQLFGFFSSLLPTCRFCVLSRVNVHQTLPSRTPPWGI